MIPVTVTLNDKEGAFGLGFDTGFDALYDGQRIFDAPYTEVDDHDDTHLVYEMFAKTVGA